MSELLNPGGVIPPIDAERRAAIEAVIERYKDEPQVDLKMEHHLHAGVYSRTMHLPKGCVAASVLISIPTQLVVSGHVLFTDGKGQAEIKGYRVLEGSAYRQAAAYALEDTAMTMFFATNAKTVEEAENEFTPEAERLLTRREDHQQCLE